MGVRGFAFCLLMVGAVSALSAQNNDRYILLKVRAGSTVKFSMSADAANTLVRMMGSSYYDKDTTISIGTGNTSFSWDAVGNYVWINGNVTKFNCSENGANLIGLDVGSNPGLKNLNCNFNSISSLDVSKNVALEQLRCKGNRLSSLDLSNNVRLYQLSVTANPFSTMGYDALMCSLPTKDSAEKAVFWPITSGIDTNLSRFMASNSLIAKEKNWKVCYGDDGNPVPATTGQYSCPEVNMDCYIAMKMKPGEISLYMHTDSVDAMVRVVCGNTDTSFVVGKSSKGMKCVTESDSMVIYGDISSFRCGGNSVYALDVSHNPGLRNLSCGFNSISHLDLSKNTRLENLDCYNNLLTSLDLSQNTALWELYCDHNMISVLDVSRNTALEGLYCHNNRLTSLDVSRNTVLRSLWCYGNDFTTDAFDLLMCSLRKCGNMLTQRGNFVPLKDTNDDGFAAFMASNSGNAKDKNWYVLDSAYNPVPATNGKFDCATVSVSEAAAESAMRVWPNPARTELHFSGVSGGSLIVHDLTGRMVWRSEACSDEIVVNIADWAKGMYFVRSGSRTLKFVKE